jgi:V/A-type H+-transporting ATPase subunit I
MIEKMSFISITGPQNDIDRVINTYIARHEIHLENTLEEFKDAAELIPYSETNPYKDALRIADELKELAAGSTAKAPVDAMTVDDAIAYVEATRPRFTQLADEIGELNKQKQQLQDNYDKVAPFKGLQYDVKKILGFSYVRFRFGRVPKQYWTPFVTYAEEDPAMIYVECAVDDDYVWIVYFVPAAEHDKVDAVYASLHFEKTFIPEDYNGTPTQVCSHLLGELDNTDTKLREVTSQQNQLINEEGAAIAEAWERISTASANFDVRKTAALTKEHGNVFYIICGWMPANEAKAFIAETQGDPDVVVLSERPDQSHTANPPTKLKNLWIAKPFEMFVRMYGLPAYGESDPTPFIALTYAFIFGAMFGDVGQGLLLLIGGGLLYHFKKIPLAGILSRAGLFSTIFGFLFGSFFGYEDILPALWLRPKEKTITIPVIGTLNTVLVVAVAFGMFMIIVSMILNIKNRFHEKEYEEAILGTNGIAGFVFYASLVLIIVLLMTGHAMPAGIVLVIMFGVPLLLIVLKEPICNAIKHKSEIVPGGKGMFAVQSFFELFEILLSYFSNTISFVRVGAFAISHAAMMEVVLMLGGYTEASPHANLIVVIIGNLIVCGLEGLVVGIQVLRLEYYEMFSRFYKGTGHEFVPYTKPAKR